MFYHSIIKRVAVAGVAVVGLAAFGVTVARAQSSGNFAAQINQSQCTINTVGGLPNSGSLQGGNGTLLDTYIKTPNSQYTTLLITPSLVTGLFNNTAITQDMPTSANSAAVVVKVTLDGNPVAECTADERRHRRRQRDFRHHQEHLPSGAADAVGQAEVNFGLAASGDPVQQRHPELRGIREREQLTGGALLLVGQCTVGIRHDVGHRGALERVALIAFVAHDDQPPFDESGQNRRRDTALTEVRGRQSCRCCGQDLQRCALPWGQTPVQAHCRQRGNPLFPERAACAARAGWHRNRQRIADSGDVVLRDPPAQLDDRLRQQRFAIERLGDVLDVRPDFNERVVPDDAAGERARPNRDPYARADWRHGQRIGDVVRKQIEERNGDCDGDQAHVYSPCKIARTLFMSSHTSRFADGVRSR